VHQPALHLCTASIGGFEALLNIHEDGGLNLAPGHYDENQENTTVEEAIVELSILETENDHVYNYDYSLSLSDSLTFQDDTASLHTFFNL